MSNTMHIMGYISSDIKKSQSATGKEVSQFWLREKIGDTYTSYRISLWGNRFDKVLHYLAKDKPIYIVGDLAPPHHYLKEGEVKIVLDINATKVILVPRESAKPEEPACAGCTTSTIQEELPF